MVTAAPGKLIAESFINPIHLVSGSAYAINENKIRLVDFSYDGTAPGEYIQNVTCN